MEVISCPDADETDRDTRIRNAQSRAIERMKADGNGAISTTVTTGVIREGLACQIRQGQFALLSDLGRGMGGDGSGPSPSFFARAAIAACVAMAIKMHAANEGRSFREVEVSVATDMCDLALWGIGDVGAAPLRTEISIDIETDEAPEVVVKIVETALARDPWYLALRDSQAIATKLTQSSSAAGLPSSD